MYYRNKYLKYKIKYLKLKGGNSITENNNLLKIDPKNPSDIFEKLEVLGKKSSDGIIYVVKLKNNDKEYIFKQIWEKSFLKKLNRKFFLKDKEKILISWYREYMEKELELLKLLGNNNEHILKIYKLVINKNNDHFLGLLTEFLDKEEGWITFNNFINNLNNKYINDEFINTIVDQFLNIITFFHYSGFSFSDFIEHFSNIMININSNKLKVIDLDGIGMSFMGWDRDLTDTIDGLDILFMQITNNNIQKNFLEIIKKKIIEKIHEKNNKKSHNYNSQKLKEIINNINQMVQNLKSI
jgi:hypothetical protein